jgi:UDP-glucose 4-epimerase
VQFLEFGRGVDTSRLKGDFGYTPAYSSRDAFDDFVRGRNLHRYIDPDRVADLERSVLESIDRRRSVHA